MNKTMKCVAGLLALCATLSLAACGGSEASSSEAASSQAASSEAASSEAASSQEGETAAESLRIALLLPGSLNDGGWNANAYAGLKELEAQGHEVAFTESLPISSMEEAFNNYAANGFDLIIGHGFEFGEPAMRVAPNYPDTKFFVSGKLPDGVAEEDIPENVGFMDMREYEAAYLAGIVAAGMTESNVIGYVAGLEIPSQLSNMAAFVTAVNEYNPDAKVYGVVSGNFEDPAKGQEAAMAQIDMGADIIVQTADSTGMGAIEAAVAKGVKLIGYGADQYELAPDLMMTCIVTDNKMVVEDQARRIAEGTFGGLWHPGVADGVCYITPYHNFEDKIPQEVKDNVNDAIERIKSGDLVVPEILDRIDNKM